MELFTPLQIGNVITRNRIVFPPITTGFEVGSVVGERSWGFCERIAEGGAGIVVVGDVKVEKGFSATPALHDDAQAPAFAELVSRVHRHGALVAAQLFYPEHNGPELMRLVATEGKERAIARMRELRDTYCNLIDVKEIQRIQELFVAAGRRARQAGVDILQIHGDRLVGMFLSDLLNRRTDHYGGPWENRVRFAVELVERLRTEIPGVPLDFKLALRRCEPPIGKGGPHLEDGQRMAQRLVAAGINSFHVCIANHGSVGDTIPAMGTVPLGCFVDLARGIRQAVSVPVAAVGRITEPQFAETILRDGSADLVALGRSLLADPDWPRKAQEQRWSKIRPCLMCNKGCTDRITRQQPLCCVVNPQGFQEGGTASVVRHQEPRKVLVVGGGPAGLSAACTAAEAGHAVQLVEKSSALGGQVLLASVPGHKKEMGRIVGFLASEARRLGVDIQLRTEATTRLIGERKPDIVIVATGARPVIPVVPMAEGVCAMSAWDALSQPPPVDGRTVVIGGGSVGVETTLHLAAAGSAVTLVELQAEVGMDESPTLRPFLLKKLRDQGVEVLTRHQLREAGHGELVLDVVGAGTSVRIPFDRIVFATGARPNVALAQELTRDGIPHVTIGDCSGSTARTMKEAIHEGYTAALSIAP